MTDDNKRAAIAAELAATERLQEAAERNASQGDRETAANRLYFAAMHATKALCLSEGIEPKSHRGLRRALSALRRTPRRARAIPRGDRALPGGARLDLSRFVTMG